MLIAAPTGGNPRAVQAFAPTAQERRKRLKLRHRPAAADAAAIAAPAADRGDDDAAAPVGEAPAADGDSGAAEGAPGVDSEAQDGADGAAHLDPAPPP